MNTSVAMNTTGAYAPVSNTRCLFTSDQLFKIMREEKANREATGKGNAYAVLLEQFHKAILPAFLFECGGNLSEIARLLGIHRETVRLYAALADVSLKQDLSDQAYTLQNLVESWLKTSEEEAKECEEAEHFTLTDWKQTAEKAGVNRETIAHLTMLHDAAKWGNDSAWDAFYSAANVLEACSPMASPAFRFYLSLKQAISSGAGREEQGEYCDCARYCTNSEEKDADGESVWLNDDFIEVDPDAEPDYDEEESEEDEEGEEVDE